jgi:nucleotide-binding universal stress UspA family protein
MTEPASPEQANAPAAPFRSVVCGIDTSPQSEEALRQAVALSAAESKLWGVSVWDPGLAMMGGIHASEVMMDLRREARQALQRAVELVPRLDPLLVRGREVAGLLATVANLEADLLSVGAHGRSRAAGVLFGSVATAMAHHATCPVLIARRGGDDSFPRLIVHATDGSAEALDAARVAGQIAAAHDSTVVTLHVADHDEDRGRGIAEGAVALIEASGREPVVRVELGSPHRRIVEVAEEAGASLVVLGSRGLSGVRALGSVSERVAQRSPCSVLIVRRTAHPTVDEESEGS